MVDEKISQKIIAEFSKSYFYDLFIYEDLQFKTSTGELELTDLLIKVNEYIVLIQIKSREEKTTADDNRWFDKKVIKKANKQHKDTRQYLKNNKPMLRFQNEVGEKIEVRNFDNFYHITIFINGNIENYTKYHDSKELGLYPVISFKDFQAICDELVTPIDILKYLDQRCMIMRKYDEKPVLLFTVEITETATAIFRGPITEQNLLDIYISREYFNSKYKPPYYKFFKDLIKFVKGLNDREFYTYLMMVFSRFDRNTVFDFCDRLILIENNSDEIYYISADTHYNIALINQEILINEYKKEKAMQYLVNEGLNKVAVFRVSLNGLEQPIEFWDLEGIYKALY